MFRKLGESVSEGLVASGRYTAIFNRIADGSRSSIVHTLWQRGSHVCDPSVVHGSLLLFTGPSLDTQIGTVVSCVDTTLGTLR